MPTCPTCRADLTPEGEGFVCHAVECPEYLSYFDDESLRAMNMPVPHEHPAIDIAVLEKALREARDAFDHLAHPNRRPRNAAEGREALGQSRSVATFQRDKITHVLGDCGTACAFCATEAGRSNDGK